MSNKDIIGNETFIQQCIIEDEKGNNYIFSGIPQVEFGKKIKVKSVSFTKPVKNRYFEKLDKLLKKGDCENEEK